MSYPVAATGGLRGQHVPGLTPRSTLRQVFGVNGGAIMVECDDSNWPLAIMVAEQAMTPTDHRLFLDRWSGWLDRARPFALLRIFASEAALAEPMAAPAEWRRWCALNGERARALVAGIATTVPRDWAGPAPGLALDGLSGVRAAVFDTSMAAVAWLRTEILRPLGLRIDSL